MPHYTLTFGRSSSPHYAAATALAAQIPGTTVTGGDGVAVHAVPLDAESLPALGALLELVVGWKRTALWRDGQRLPAGTGVARKTAYKWWRRWLAEGEAGLQDRSSRPRRSPTRVPARVERKIERLRRRRKLGPMRIGWRLGLASSTVYRVLCRLGLNRLAWLDRPTGRVIRRLYEHPRPGDLLHIDVKKLGRIPPGGGWRAHGRGRDGHGGHSRVGYAYIRPPSTTTPVSPTARFWPTSARSPRSRSGSARAAGSPSAASASGPCSPTTVRATAAPTSLAPAWPPASAIAAPAPTGGRPTARSNASTAPSSRSGPTSASTAARRPAPPRLPAGCISTIITAATPPSAATRRSTV